MIILAITLPLRVYVYTRAVSMSVQAGRYVEK